MAVVNVIYKAVLSKTANASEINLLNDAGFKVKRLNGKFVAVKRERNPLMMEIQKQLVFLERLSVVGVVEEYEFSVSNEYGNT